MYREFDCHENNHDIVSKLRIQTSKWIYFRPVYIIIKNFIKIIDSTTINRYRAKTRIYNIFYSPANVQNDYYDTEKYVLANKMYCLYGIEETHTKVNSSFNDFLSEILTVVTVCRTSYVPEFSNTLQYVWTKRVHRTKLGISYFIAFV